MDLTQYILDLFPSGAAWRKDESSQYFKLARGLSVEMGRLVDLADSIFLNSFPTSATHQLDAWRQIYKMDGASAQEIGALAVATGGCTPEYIERVLRTAGYKNPKVIEYRPLTAANFRAGMRVSGSLWGSNFTIVIGIDETEENAEKIMPMICPAHISYNYQKGLA